MIDLDWLTTIVGAHIGHSVALSAVLACSLIFARKMSGGARYALCSFALLGAIVLPAIALTPGASLVNRLLGAVNAPITFSAPPHLVTLSDKAPQEAPAAVKLEALPFPTSAAASGGNALSGGRSFAPDNRRAEGAATAADPGILDQAATGSLASDTSVVLQNAVDTTAKFPPAAWVTGAMAATNHFLAGLPDLSLFFFSAWIVGTLVLLAKTARDLVASVRMVRGSRAIELPPALAHRFADVRIAVSEQAPGPIAAGVINPSILLPVGFETELEHPGIVALLEHERAHVERRDMLVALGQRIALAVLWWSPAMHWISRRMDEEREVACDEIAVERTGDPRAFALTLTHQAESQLWARTPHLAAGAIGGRSQFGRRISRLVELARGGKTGADAGVRTSGRFAYTGMALVAIVAACLTPGMQAKAQDQESDIYDETNGFDLRVIRVRADQSPPAPPAPPAVLLDPPSVAPLAPVVPPVPEAPETFEFLADDAASFGIEFSSLITEEVLGELPDLLEEIFETIEESGVADAEFSTEWRTELADMRKELRAELGPEIRIHIERELNRARSERDRELARASAERTRAISQAHREVDRARSEMSRELDRARAEIDRARSEFTRAMATNEAQNLSREEREEIREQMDEVLEEAHEQLRDVRENGKFDFDFDFNLDSDEYENVDERLDGGQQDGSRRGPNAGDFYLEFNLDDLQNLSGPQASPIGVEDHARAAQMPGTPSNSARRIGQYDCPQKG